MRRSFRWLFGAASLTQPIGRGGDAGSGNRACTGGPQSADSPTFENREPLLPLVAFGKVEFDAVGILEEGEAHGRIRDDAADKRDATSC